MILPKEELKYLIYYSENNREYINDDFMTVSEDKITLYYSEKKTLFGFRYNKKYTKTFLFYRCKTSSWSGFTKTESFNEFQNQINDILSDNWYAVDEDTYYKLKHLNPELFL
jgi:hypothetical protein